MTDTTFTDRLRLAGEYMNEHGWTKGEERDSYGQVCLTGAIRYCAPEYGDFYLIREVLRRQGRAEGWNDGDATEVEVANFLATAEITDADLLETFGPQWAEIVEMVRMAASITNYQLSRVRRAGDAAWDVAEGAARDAVGDVAGDAAWYAAWSAAGDAAGYAAGGAAGALSARHLIAASGFTQAHYDALTTPWRETIGRIHPEDADIYQTTEKTS